MRWRDRRARPGRPIGFLRSVLVVLRSGIGALRQARALHHIAEVGMPAVDALIALGHSRERAESIVASWRLTPPHVQTHLDGAR